MSNLNEKSGSRYLRLISLGRVMGRVHDPPGPTFEFSKDLIHIAMDDEADELLNEAEYLIASLSPPDLAISRAPTTANNKKQVTIA